MFAHRSPLWGGLVPSAQAMATATDEQKPAFSDQNSQHFLILSLSETESQVSAEVAAHEHSLLYLSSPSSLIPTPINSLWDSSQL